MLAENSLSLWWSCNMYGLFHLTRAPPYGWQCCLPTLGQTFWLDTARMVVYGELRKIYKNLQESTEMSMPPGTDTGISATFSVQPVYTTASACILYIDIRSMSLPTQLLCLVQEVCMLRLSFIFTFQVHLRGSCLRLSWLPSCTKISVTSACGLQLSC